MKIIIKKKKVTDQGLGVTVLEKKLKFNRKIISI